MTSSLVEATTRMAQVLFEDEEMVEYDMLTSQDDLNPYREWILKVIDQCGKSATQITDEAIPEFEDFSRKAEEFERALEQIQELETRPRDEK